MAEAAASIITLLGVAKKVSRYIRTAKDAPQERNDLQGDLATTIGVLFYFQDYVEDNDYNDEFQQTIALLTVK